MRKFTTLTAIPCPLNEANIDTDIIFPARFLLLMYKIGLGKHVFKDRRSDPDFILNQTPYEKSEILICGPNFGIGSSREQAVWALADFGIRCIIAPSFGDIFFNNCFKNGILPIAFSGQPREDLLQAGHEKTSITIDLEAQQISISGRAAISFNIDAHNKTQLLSGLDEIGSILADDLPSIEDFERKQRHRRPWHFHFNTHITIGNLS